MLRGNEFFYEQEEAPQFMIQTSAWQVIRDPKLFTAKPITVAPAKEEKKEEKKDKPVVLRASICCSSCVDLIKADFRKVTGIKDVDKDVDYDFFKRKVTVRGSATVADVLSAARRHFKDAELWN